MNVTVGQELRPCKVKLGKVIVNGLFHGIWQHGYPHTALMVGDTSGQIMNPVAVVEVDGFLHQVNIISIEFTDVAKEQSNENKGTYIKDTSRIS